MRTAPCNRIKENDVMNKKTEELEEIIGYHLKINTILPRPLPTALMPMKRSLASWAVMRDWSFWEMLCWS